MARLFEQRAAQCCSHRPLVPEAAKQRLHELHEHNCGLTEQHLQVGGDGFHCASPEWCSNFGPRRDCISGQHGELSSTLLFAVGGQPSREAVPALARLAGWLLHVSQRRRGPPENHNAVAQV